MHQVHLTSVGLRVTARKKSKYRVYFSVFYLSGKSLYSVQILENTDQKKLLIWALSRSETYSEPCHTSKVYFFTKTVNALKRKTQKTSS